MARRRKSKNGPGGFTLIIGVILLVMAAGCFLTSKAPPATKEEQPSSTTETTVLEKVVDNLLPETVKEKLQESKTEDKKANKEAKVEKEEEAKAEKKLQEIKEETVEQKKEEAKTPPQQKEEPKTTVKGEQFSGKLAVVIDDCGYDLPAVKSLTSLPVPMSFAIIPFKTHSSEALSVIKGANKLAMLHLPMEPINAGEASEREMVKVGMSTGEIDAYVKKALDSLPGVKGVNNHQGSKATADRATMTAVLKLMQSRKLFFLDSRTSAASLAEEIAHETKVLSGSNQLFLDNSSDVGAIKKQILLAARRATKNGSAIVICHARPNTAKAWQEIYAQLQEGGIRFVSVDRLLY